MRSSEIHALGDRVVASSYTSASACCDLASVVLCDVWNSL